METAIWAAIVGTIGLVLTCVAYVVKITRTVSNDINEVKATAVAASGRADIAGINVAANSLKVEKVATELAKHREDVAKEYVSYQHMTSLENRLIDAITSLGNRIDGLFTRASAH